ncbi:MAG: 30S ribosomal protein S11 [Verrucomicrobia bacterium]|nr:MAG: 30S ribosomal protein S11 [Verrucomicrobiota bacterium]
MSEEEKESSEEEAPKAEEEAPKAEEETPKVEEETPKVEEKTPKPEEEAPKAEEEAPKAEEEAPKAEEETPKAEEETPKAEEETPKAEEETPNTEESSDKDKKKKTAADVLLELDGPDADPKQKVVKSKGSKNVHSGVVHVLATFNNTIVTVSDKRGNVIGWSTAGKMGFRGSRKSTAYAAQVVSQDACRQAMGHGLKEADVKVKGPGSGRESAVRAVQGIGIEVKSISDVTPIPHNGCRPKKARRV